MTAYVVPMFLLVKDAKSPQDAQSKALDAAERASQPGRAGLILLVDEGLPTAALTEEVQQEVYPHSILDCLPHATIRALLD